MWLGYPCTTLFWNRLEGSYPTSYEYRYSISKNRQIYRCTGLLTLRRKELIWAIMYERSVTFDLHLNLCDAYPSKIMKYLYPNISHINFFDTFRYLSNTSRKMYYGIHYYKSRHFLNAECFPNVSDTSQTQWWWSNHPNKLRCNLDDGVIKCNSLQWCAWDILRDCSKAIQAIQWFLLILMKLAHFIYCKTDFRPANRKIVQSTSSPRQKHTVQKRPSSNLDNLWS